MIIPARVRASMPREDGRAPRRDWRRVRAREAGSGTLLHFACAVDAVTGVGQGLQPRLGNRRTTLLTLAVGPLVDAVQGFGDLVQHLLLVLNEAERKFLLEVIGPEVR